ncbi:hypothetical protein [Foetidibacter luteolus]|uniref:hypothetical protein n=1 Tax=Foetidibacter luteolus TaxID=2608880 RepID=UPI00129A2C82|nr:hypothetical protein [Foetidibacter luteolus]
MKYPAITKTFTLLCFLLFIVVFIVFRAGGFRKASLGQPSITANIEIDTSKTFDPDTTKFISLYSSSKEMFSSSKSMVVFNQFPFLTDSFKQLVMEALPGYRNLDKPLFP